MLLAIDVGNTNIVAGLFDGRHLRNHWRLSSRVERTADEYLSAFHAMAQAWQLDLGSCVDAVIIGSVVPAINASITDTCRQWLGRPLYSVSADLDLGIDIQVKEPHRVGVDRLLNATAASYLYSAPCITLDMGTATKFDVVDSGNRFIGGAIAPGLHTASVALVQGTALLPGIDYIAPPSAIGDDTISAMQSGIVFGYLSLIEGLLNRIKLELGEPTPPVIATGGLASLLVSQTSSIDQHVPHLTLLGLQIVFERNFT